MRGMGVLVLGLLALTGLTRPAMAAGFDGRWSVLVITEKGTCDQVYRYGVSVSGGRLKYDGEASIDMAGTVASNGAVTVSIRLGEQGANGIGRLTGNAGAGTWRSVGRSSDCAGRWEAERR